MYQQLKQYIENKGISQTQVAKAMGIGKSTLNNYLKNKYTGDVAGVDEKAKAYLQLQAEREKIKKLNVPFVETESAEQALNFLALTHHFGEMGIFYGGAGTGKTTVLKEYARRSPSCVLIEPDTGYTAKVLLQEICRKLGQSDKGNMHDMTERIVDVLRDSGRILMIDEAELLPLRALESVRRIQDKSQCGVVLAGMPKLLINLRGANMELKQLFSRVSMRHEFGEMIAESDLQMIAAAILPQHDEAFLSKLVETSKGNVRKLSKLLMILDYLIQTNRQNEKFNAFSPKLIEHANNYLMH